MFEQEKKKGKKKSKAPSSATSAMGAMQMPGQPAPASATTSSAPEISVSAPRKRVTAAQPAQVEEVFDSDQTQSIFGMNAGISREKQPVYLWIRRGDWQHRMRYRVFGEWKITRYLPGWFGSGAVLSELGTGIAAWGK